MQTYVKATVLQELVLSAKSSQALAAAEPCNCTRSVTMLCAITSIPKCQRLMQSCLNKIVTLTGQEFCSAVDNMQSPVDLTIMPYIRKHSQFIQLF